MISIKKIITKNIATRVETWADYMQALIDNEQNWVLDGLF